MKYILILIVFCIFLFGFNVAEEDIIVYKSDNLIVYKLTEHVYRHTSFLETKTFGMVPCNGMIVTNMGESIVLDTTVDDESSSELIDWITKTLKAKIIAVIPTHSHVDNLGGLNAFHNKGVPSFALQKTIQIAKENEIYEPQHGFEHYYEFIVGGEKVIVEFLGKGHTCDNVIGFFPSEGIMFGGCLIKENGAGKGNLTEAFVDEWSETVRKVKLKYPNTKRVIPGHGRTGGVELFDYTLKLFEQ